MAQPAQCSGGGWATSRPVGDQERAPTTSQNKSYHDRQYKKALAVHSEEQQRKREK